MGDDAQQNPEPQTTGSNPAGASYAPDTDDRRAIPPRRERYPIVKWYQAAFFATAQFLLRRMYRLLYRTRIEGVEHVPLSGPALVVCNHQSLFDPPLVGCWYRRASWFIARESLFKGPFGLLIAFVNAIPIKRGEPDTAAIKRALAVLEQGGLVVLFPEGTRTPDGEIKDFQRGIALLLKKAKCPVVPAALDGPFDAFPRGEKPKLLFSGVRFRVRYGEAIAPEELLADGPDAALQRIRDRVVELHAGLDDATVPAINC